MIEFNNYDKYINNNNNLTICQQQIFKQYKKNLNTFYVSRKSNLQIKTLFLNIYKNNAINKLTKITLLFYTFFSNEFTDELIMFIKNNEVTDEELINLIINKSKNNKKLFEPERKRNNICNEWTYIIQNLIKTFKKINNSSSITYLDVGCGSGNKTLKIALELNLDKNNIYGADITNWGPYNQKKYDHKFNFINIIDDKIDCNTNKFDFISCILMLHHVKNLNKLLTEIKRILKPNGILLIIEHNNYDDYDNLTLDILHMLYGYLYDKNNRYLANPDYANYYNWLEWDYIMDKYNFTYIKSNLLFTELSNEIRYDNIFYTFYKNEKSN